MLTQAYLQSQHFGPDTMGPKANNRWEKKVGHEKWPDYFVSVTFTPDGSAALYGIINFYGYDISSASQPFQYIKEHRFFNGPITIEQFNRFTDKNAPWTNIR